MVINIIINMPSSTATTLASNRRKLRLAQHNNRGLTPSPTAQLAKLAVAVSSEPQQHDDDDNDINNNNNNNNSNSPTPSPTLTAVSSNGSHEESLDPSVQQQQQQQHRSRSGNRRTIAAAAAASSKNPHQQHQSSTTTSRGRSRRSRAATARRWHTGGGSSSTTSSRNSIRQDEILAGLEDVEMAAAATDSVSPTIDNKSNNNNNNNNNDDATNNLALNLHVTESVDSDDNGTCFNSIGTTTPKQPNESTQKDASSENNSAKEVASNNSNRLLHQPNLHTNNSNYHISESSKQTLLPAKNASQARRSKFEMAWNSDSASSPHNHNNPLSPLNEGGNSVTSMSQSSYPSPPPKKSNLEQRHLERTLQGRKGVMSNRKKGDSIWDHPEEMMGSSNNNNNTNNHRDRNNNNRGGDNSTAYSDFEQDGNSHARGRPRGRDARATGGASIDSDAGEKQMMESAMGFAQQKGGDNACGEGGEGVDALLNKPNMKAALGVGAAATLGGKWWAVSYVSLHSLL